MSPNKQWIRSVQRDEHKQFISARKQAAKEQRERVDQQERISTEAREPKPEPAAPQKRTERRARIHTPPPEPRLEVDKADPNIVHEILPDGTRRRFRPGKRRYQKYGEEGGSHETTEQWMFRFFRDRF
jgi:hypothetical protein